jgi:hypothetical protein
MFRHAAVCVGVIAFTYGTATSARAGYYSSIDNPDETRWALDYQVFSDKLMDLASIAANDYPRYVPIRQRYLLLEAMAGDSLVNLKTLGQKLDYSTMLIRRGRSVDAVQFLAPLVEENPKNFLVLSHCATAHFLAPPDFQRKSAYYMKRALDNWPTNWADLKDDQKKFLASRGWEETAFERFRRYEVFFDRLIRNRLDEEKQLAQKKTVEESVDPIFSDSSGKPIRFTNESGSFEAGRIAKAEFEKLPKDAVQAVEQLMIWMPHDRRLEWLLGEVFNASAMDRSLTEDERNDAIRNAYKIFDKMVNPLDSVRFGLAEVKSRHEKLREAVSKLPPPRTIIIETPNGKPGVLPDDTPEPSWRPVIIWFLTGLAVGLFTLWQYQEIRRRRQARA